MYLLSEVMGVILENRVDPDQSDVSFYFSTLPSVRIFKSGKTLINPLSITYNSHQTTISNFAAFKNKNK